MENIPHHGINIKDPNEDFDVCKFQKYAFQTIEEIQKRNKNKTE